MSLKYNDITLRSSFPGEVDTPAYVSDLDATTFPKAKHYQSLLDSGKYEEAESYLNAPSQEDLRRCMSSAKLLNELQDRICAAQITINARDAKPEVMMQAEKPAYINQNTGKFWIEEIGTDSNGNKYGRLYIRVGENLGNSEYSGVKIEPGTRKEESKIGNGSFVTGKECIGSGANQTVIGKYNKSDDNNKYAFIVGGGSSDDDRKNILSVDWDGNLVAKKDIKLQNGASLSEINSREPGIEYISYDESEVNEIDIDNFTGEILPIGSSSLITGSFGRIRNNQSLKDLNSFHLFLIRMKETFSLNGDLHFVLATFYYGMSRYKQELSLYLDYGNTPTIHIATLERVGIQVRWNNWSLISFPYFDITNAISIESTYRNNVTLKYAYVENGIVNISMHVILGDLDFLKNHTSHNVAKIINTYNLFAPRHQQKYIVPGYSINTPTSYQRGSYSDLLASGTITLNTAMNSLGDSTVFDNGVNCDINFCYPIYLH